MERSHDELQSRYLEVIIGLLLQLRDPARPPASAREQMGILQSLGLEASEIARILGKDAAQVSKELYKIRQSKKPK